MTQQALLSPEAVIQEFKNNGITHIVYLPDSETNWMYQLMEAEPDMDLVPVTREGESIAVAAGVIAGGKKIPEREALQMAFSAIDAGAAGVDMGRNIFQSDNPVGMIKAVRAIVHENATLDDAWSVLQDTTHTTDSR